MKFPKSVLYITATFAMAGLSAMALPTVQSPDETLTELSLTPDSVLSLTPDSVLSPALPDTVEVITPDSIATLASEAFKTWSLRKLDGEDGTTLYPAAYDLYLRTADAINLQPEGSRGQIQCRDILKQINPELLKGAFFFSSAGDKEGLNRFARAYLDTQLLPQMNAERWNRDQKVFPSICYIAASSAYNSQEWDRAIEYFKLYLSSGDTERREQVYQFMGHAALDAKNYPVAIATMQEAIKQYPLNELMPMIGIQACVDGGHAQFLQDFLTHALTLKPNDDRLLTLQGELHEDNHNHRAALDIFNKLDQLAPNRLSVTKHLGMNYYNMAVTAFNRAINESNEKAVKQQRSQARNYFDAAAQKFMAVLETDPTSIKYLRALGVCYLCLEDKESFAGVNQRLSAMGVDPLENVFMPPMMSYSESGSKNFATSNLSDANASIDAPTFTEFATKYVTDQLGKWAIRGEFEPQDRYDERVNDNTIMAEKNRLYRLAADEYLNQYSGDLRLNDLKLRPYNANDEVFQIDTNFGPIVVHVPLKNNEAETFKATFAAIDISTPRYYVDEEGVKLASITLITPGGRSYKYDNAKALEYHELPQIDIDFNSILRPTASAASSKQNSRNTVTIQRKSDVDDKIPVNSRKNPNRLALIIANEQYANTPDVPSAINDGVTMAEYCKKVMGMPDDNVVLLTNASLTDILGEISNLRNRVDVLNGQAEVVVYYAGHGFPDEGSKDAYLLPVDGRPKTLRTCYPLSEFYADLGSMNARGVMVFLDACFSGAQRTVGNEMISQDARAVVIKPKAAAPKGNMFVLSATSDNETALPYADKNHGLFTYYLLKHLQDTKGNTSLKQLSDYVISNVKRESVFINKKLQTPTVNLAGNMSGMWEDFKLRP